MHVSFSQEDPHAGPAFLIKHSVGREPSSAHVHEDFGTEKKFMFFFFLSL